ncbi:MAG TPA: DUF4157 domain-containing protein [Anaeromyxobacteraceae bacterium]|nr:DUF4157 domain-containing protein [Anaeromyxobacteraceae bacterium]
MAELAFQRKEKERARVRRPAAPEAEPSSARAEPARLGPHYAAFDLLAGDAQRAAAPLPPAGTGAAALEAAEAAARAPEEGAPLSPALRADLERRFGRDLSGVRVHTGPPAAAAAVALHAAAFTQGRHIHLATPALATEPRLLAHELTHVVQQGAAPPLRLASPARAPRATAFRAAGPRAAPAPAAPRAVQRFGLDDLYAAGRAVGGAVASGIRTTAGAVVEAGRNLVDLGRDALMAVVRKVAPDFLPLFQGDGIAGFLRDLVKRGLRSLFEGLLAPLRKYIDFDEVGRKVRMAIGWLQTISAQLARNDCSGVIAAAKRVAKFFSDALKPAMDKIKKISAKVSEFFKSIWDAIGAPVMDVLRRIGGAIWDSFKGFVDDAAALVRKVRAALGAAWGKVKGWLGIPDDDGNAEGGGFWGWIRDKAIAVGSAISEKIGPLIGPLRQSAGVLMLVTPGMQVLGIFLLWPELKAAWNELVKYWDKLDLIPKARRVLTERILPWVMDKAEAVAQALLGAADWVLGILDRVAGFLSRAVDAAPGILPPLKRLVQFARDQFHRLVGWARSGLGYVSRHFRTLVQRLLRFLGKVMEVLLQLVIMVLNPPTIIGFLAGTIWLALPECLKPIIIDFIVDLLIALVGGFDPGTIATILFFPLWPVVKAGLLGFLGKVKSYAMDRKVKVADKIARIIGLQSAGFALGLLKGLLIGIWDGITAPFQAVAALFDLPGQIQSFLENLGLKFCELVEKIRCFAANLASTVFGSLDKILSALQELFDDPGKIFELIQCAVEGVLAGAQSIGEALADQMMAVLEGAEEAIGEAIGKIIGNVLVQAVIEYFTAGAGTAIPIIQQLSEWLGAVGKAIEEVIKWVKDLLGKLVKWIKELALKFVNWVKGKVKGILSKMGAWLRKVAKWLAELFEKAREWWKKHFGLSTEEKLEWDAFLGELHGAINQRGDAGMTGAEVSELLRGLSRKYSKVVKWPRFAVPWRGRRYIIVRRVKSLFPRHVGTVLYDRQTRWQKGTRAVEKRLRKVGGRDTNIPALERILLPLKTRWHFSSLYPRHDSSREVFDVYGEMSPGGPPFTNVPDLTGLHDGSYSDPIPIKWYKPPGAYPPSISIKPRPGVKTRIAVDMRSNTKVKDRGGNERRVGINGTNVADDGSRLFRMSTPRGGEASRFKNLLNSLGYNWAGKQADHVRDLAFSGVDGPSNLWPLDANINQRAYAGRWYADYRIQFIERRSGRKPRKEVLPIRDLRGKHFRVIGIRFPASPNPGGRDPR